MNFYYWISQKGSSLISTVTSDRNTQMNFLADPRRISAFLQEVGASALLPATGLGWAMSGEGISDLEHVQPSL